MNAGIPFAFAETFPDSLKAFSDANIESNHTVLRLLLIYISE